MATDAFFRSRWVQRPAHVTEVEPTRLPAGFRAAGVAAGLKPEGLDVGLLVSEHAETVSAARFTTNARVGAPVTVSREADTGRLRAVVANSGGSNTGDGERGLQTARATQQVAAELLGIEPGRVGVASTGVIGTELPREPLLEGVRAAVAQLGDDADGLSRSILTSDRAPKRACLEVALPEGPVTLSAQAKGAGMISPRFATMLCFVETDAELSAETAELLLGVPVKRSFDRATVDGQLSTNDTALLLCSGASGVQVTPESEDELRFGEALDALLRQLAVMMVVDGEGAARAARVIVRGGHADGVEAAARAVANSPLVKAALHGGDPNWGRIEGMQVCSEGAAISYDEAELDRLVQREEVEYEVGLPGEGAETEVFFSDLSQDYVEFNSAYTT